MVKGHQEIADHWTNKITKHNEKLMEQDGRDQELEKIFN
jgi:hypothetical protein